MQVYGEYFERDIMASSKAFLHAKDKDLNGVFSIRFALPR